MISIPTDVGYSSDLKIKNNGRDYLCSSKLCLHRNFSSSKIWVIPPQLYQRLHWAGAVALLPQLPMPSHLFPITSSTVSIRYPQFRHHRRPQVHSMNRSTVALLVPGWRYSPRPCTLFKACQSLGHAIISLPDSSDKPYATLGFMPTDSMPTDSRP